MILRHSIPVLCSLTCHRCPLNMSVWASSAQISSDDQLIRSTSACSSLPPLGDRDRDAACRCTSEAGARQTAETCVKFLSSESKHLLTFSQYGQHSCAEGRVHNSAPCLWFLMPWLKLSYLLSAETEGSKTEARLTHMFWSAWMKRTACGFTSMFMKAKPFHTPRMVCDRSGSCVSSVYSTQTGQRQACNIRWMEKINTSLHIKQPKSYGRSCIPLWHNTHAHIYRALVESEAVICTWPRQEHRVWL